MQITDEQARIIGQEIGKALADALKPTIKTVDYELHNYDSYNGLFQTLIRAAMGGNAGISSSLLNTIPKAIKEALSKVVNINISKD